MTRAKLATLCKIGLAVFWLTLFAGTHIPIPPHSILTRVSDKLEHASAYAALALLLATTWELAVGRLNGRHLVMVWIGVAIYGVLDEITQIPVGRDCEFRDWLADVSGAAVGLLVFVVLRKIIEHRLRADPAE